MVLNPAGLPAGVCTAHVRIVSQDPAVQNGDQTVQVKLAVSDEIHQVLLPTIMRQVAPQ